MWNGMDPRNVKKERDRDVDVTYGHVTDTISSFFLSPFLMGGVLFLRSAIKRKNPRNPFRSNNAFEKKLISIDYLASYAVGSVHAFFFLFFFFLLSLLSLFFRPSYPCGAGLERDSLKR